MAKVVKFKLSKFDKKLKEKFGSQFQWLKPDSKKEYKRMRSLIILFGILATGGLIIFFIIPGSTEMTAKLVGVTTTTTTTSTTTTTLPTTTTTTTTTIPTTTTTLGPPHMLALEEISCSDELVSVVLRDVGKFSSDLTNLGYLKFYVDGVEDPNFMCSKYSLISGDTATCKIGVEGKGLHEIEIRGICWVEETDSPNIMRANVVC